jgi:hypothetical protein
MSGLEISWSERNGDLPTDESLFAHTFRTILPELAAYTWLFDPTDYYPFRGIGNPEFERVDEQLPGVGIIPPGTLLPRFAKYVIDDWCDLFGFFHPPARPEDFFTNLRRAEKGDGKVAARFFSGCRKPEEWAAADKRYFDLAKSEGTATGRYLANTVDICFCNLQGLIWEIYTRSNNLLNSVRAHVRGIERVSYWETELTRRC